MAYHLIPFVAGTVIGGLAVYLFRDERVRKDLRQSAGSLSRKAQETAGEVSGKVATGLRQVRESMPAFGQSTESAGTEAAVEEPVPKPRKTVRRRAAGKSPTRSIVPKRVQKVPPPKPEEPEDL